MKQYEIKYRKDSGYSEDFFYKTVTANSFGEANSNFFVHEMFRSGEVSTKDVTVISITLLQD